MTLVGASIASVVVSGCGPSDKVTCSATTCPTGCCDAEGVCQAGTTLNACGVAGAACQSCSSSEVCGGGQCSVPGNNNNNGKNPEQWCEDYLDAYCDYAVRCGQMHAKESCIEASRLVMAACRAQIQPAIQKGRMTIDGGRISTCFAFISNEMSCEDESGDPTTASDDCNAMFTGTVAAGGACYVDLECTEGHYCDDSSTCPGICTPQVGVGETASRSSACETGLYLYWSNDTCQAPVAAGASCAPLPGAFDPQECVAGHFCDSDTELCTPNRAAGEACTDSAECEGTLRCLEDQCRAIGGPGASCTSWFECKSDLYCEEAPEGMPGTCKVLGGMGSPCVDSDACKPGLTCAGAGGEGPGQCAEPTALGGSCEDSASCGSDGYCLEGTCTARKASGEPCTEYFECAAGYCAGDVCGEFFDICLDSGT